MGFPLFLSRPSRRTPVPVEEEGNGISYILYDTCVDVEATLLENHTPDIGGPWIKYSNAASIRGNKVRNDTQSLTCYAVDVGVVDWIMEIEASPGTYGGWYLIRWQDSTDYIGVRWLTTGNLYIHRTIGGVYTNYATKDVGGYNANHVAKITISNGGNDCLFEVSSDTINDSLTATGMTHLDTLTNPGFRFDLGSGEYNYYCNFKIWT